MAKSPDKQWEDFKVRPADKKLLKKIAAETDEPLYEVFHRLVEQEFKRVSKSNS